MDILRPYSMFYMHIIPVIYGKEGTQQCAKPQQHVLYHRCLKTNKKWHSIVFLNLKNGRVLLQIIKNGKSSTTKVCRETHQVLLILLYTIIQNCME